MVLHWFYPPAASKRPRPAHLAREVHFAILSAALSGHAPRASLAPQSWQAGKFLRGMLDSLTQVIPASWRPIPCARKKFSQKIKVRVDKEEDASIKWP